MARAARYGSISPSEFLEMDIDDGAELARRVTELWIDEVESQAKFQLELTKALMKAQGAKIT